MDIRHILSIFFIFLSLFHSALFLAPSLQVSGNFEFSKVMLFHILSSITIVYFLIKKRIRFNTYILILNVFITLSIIFSPSPFISFFWDASRWHGLLMFLELSFLLSIFLWLESQERKSIQKAIIIWLIPLCVIAIKELFYPSFDYGELSTRAIGTFWHPSFLALYILMILPFIYDKIFNNKRFIYIPILLLSVITLIYTKHSFWIILAIGFSCYFFVSGKIRLKKSKSFIRILGSIICLMMSITTAYISLIYYPEKFHSLISRWYIWETTLNIIFSSPKIIFLGNGPETLDYFFMSFKNSYLYIFENFWYTADRAHNIFLDAWYSFWLWGILLYLFCFVYLLKNFEKNPYYESCLIFFIFNLLNFPWINSYLLFIFFFSKILKDNKHFFEVRDTRINTFFIPVFILTAVFWILFFSSEVLVYKKNYQKANEFFPYPDTFIELREPESALKLEQVKSKKYFQSKIYFSADKEKFCKEFVDMYPAVENYFFCGKIFEDLGKKDLSISYYRLWLVKVPDLRNTDSIYWENYFIRKSITGNRFFSEKYSDIKSILKLVNTSDWVKKQAK